MRGTLLFVFIGFLSWAVCNPVFPEEFKAWIVLERITPDGQSTSNPGYWLSYSFLQQSTKISGHLKNVLNKDAAIIKGAVVGGQAVDFEFFDRRTCQYDAFNVSVARMHVEEDAVNTDKEKMDNIWCDVYEHHITERNMSSIWYVNQGNPVAHDNKLATGAIIRMHFGKFTTPVFSETEFALPAYGCYQVNKPADKADVLSNLPEQFDALEEFEMVNSAHEIMMINEKAHEWTAGVNKRFEGLSIADAKRLLGWNGRTANFEFQSSMQLRRSAPSPHFDARYEWPQCSSIAKIRDQGKCGSCWAFGAVNSMTDRFCIASQGSFATDLSVQDILNCDPRDNSCKGGFDDYAHYHLRDFGVSSGACQPYEEADDTCVDYCPGDDSQIRRFRYSKVYTPGADEEDIMADIELNGPLELCFIVYKDLMTYKTGVYSRTTNEALGGHCVRVVGWGQQGDTKYWTCANSWGSDWGENGFFRIKRGVNECNIEAMPGTGIPLL